jgi:hypothetical protein
MSVLREILLANNLLRQLRVLDVPKSRSLERAACPASGEIEALGFVHLEAVDFLAGVHAGGLVGCAWFTRHHIMETDR